MTRPCTNCPLNSTPGFKTLSPTELTYIQRFKSGEMSVKGGTIILEEGQPNPRMYTVLTGMGLRYKTLETGKRQVLNMVFPGDLLGLQGNILGDMGHSIEATTDMTLCVFDRSALMEFYRNNTERALDLTWLVAKEERFLGEALAAVGQRSAMESMTWAFLKIFQRGQLGGMVKDGRMRFPYRQLDLADALGLSLVHTNKTLAKLRGAKLLDWQDGILSIPDPEALATFAQIDMPDSALRPFV